MSEITERERACVNALPRNPYRSGIAAEYVVRDVLAVLDAARAYDAAQKAAEPVQPGATLRHCGYCERWASKPCGEGCHWSPKDPPFAPENPTGPREGKADADPVAVVREAMGRLDKSGWSNAMPAVVWHVDRWRHPEGRSAHCDTSDGALATILNTLEKSPLLERAERSMEKNAVTYSAGVADGARTEGERQRGRYETGYREGVAEGLEIALAWCGERDAGAAHHIRAEIARIRDGGPIETGGTTAGDSVASPLSNAPEGQAQAGGAPGMPTGWINATWIANVLEAARNGEDPAGAEIQALCGMARDAIKLREAMMRIAYGEADSGHSPHFGIARRALASLETDNG